MNSRTKPNYIIAATVLIILAAGYIIWKESSAKTRMGFNSKSQSDSSQNKQARQIKNAAADSLQTMNSKDSTGKEINPVAGDTIPRNWKMYKDKKLNISFRYPGTWMQVGGESGAINRKGEMMSVIVRFTDTLSHSALFIEYHLPPYGAELFKYEKSQFNSSKKNAVKEIRVAGNRALQSFSTMDTDIKGNVYDPPIKFVHTVFLDKQQTGEYSLQFRTPAPNSETEIAKFNRLLSTLKFN